MSAFGFSLLRLAFLALLWVFVLALAMTLRRDINGTQVRNRRFARGGKSSQSPSSIPLSPALAAVDSPRPALSPNHPAPSTSHPASLNLVVTDGAMAGTTIPLGSSPIVVGRSPDCALVLADHYSSSRHARIFPAHGNWWVEDLDSTNGTFVERQRISTPTQLSPGMPVTIGRTTLELRS